MKRYIDADKLLAQLGINSTNCDECEWSDEIGYCKRGSDFVDCCVAIEEAPIADVRENVRGEWQKVDEQPYFRKHFHKVCCSVCRKQGYDYWNFCPNCGADMRGDQS